MKHFLLIIFIAFSFSGIAQNKRIEVFSMLLGNYKMVERKDLKTNDKTFTLLIKSTAYAQITEYFTPLTTKSIQDMKSELEKWKDFTDEMDYDVSQKFDNYQLTDTKKGLQVSALNRNDHYGYVSNKLIDKMIEKMEKYKRKQK